MTREEEEAKHDPLTCVASPQVKIGSLKKELPIHNSLKKELKESILQLPTPEWLALYEKVSSVLFFSFTLSRREDRAT